MGIGVDQDAARLPLDQPLEQPLELRILRDEMDIRLHLRRAVAQPHRLDIAGDDESVGAAVERHRLHRRVERVRIAILEQPRSEEHTSELQSLMRTSYAVFCLNKK